MHWYEGSQGPVLDRLWPGAPAGAFGLGGHAALPDVLVPAFSAAYRREFVENARLAFPTGMFTDVAWSALAALRADRIAVLDRICVRHLQRRQGARNRLPGAHHLELLDQFDLVMQEATGLKLPKGTLNALFRRLVHEVLKTAATPGRLPSTRLRRRFFRRAAGLYRQHRPAGFCTPGGSVGLQHRLLATGAYAAFQVLRGAKGSTALAARLRPRPRTRTPYARHLRRPVDEKLAVYCAYWGRGYTCSPAAIHAPRGAWPRTSARSSWSPRTRCPGCPRTSSTR